MSTTPEELIASYWLYLWAECWRIRAAEGDSSLYARGAPDGKEYRPVDDPKAMFFVFAQVEHALGDPSGVRWGLASHVWIHRRAVEEFHHPDLAGTSRGHLFDLRKKIIGRLGRQIRCTAPEVITPRSVREARERILLERKHPGPAGPRAA